MFYHVATYEEGKRFDTQSGAFPAKTAPEARRFFKAAFSRNGVSRDGGGDSTRFRSAALDALTRDGQRV